MNIDLIMILSLLLASCVVACGHLTTNSITTIEQVPIKVPVSVPLSLDVALLRGAILRMEWALASGECVRIAAEREHLQNCIAAVLNATAPSASPISEVVRKIGHQSLTEGYTILEKASSYIT